MCARANEFNMPLIYPIHLRSLKQMKKFRLEPHEFRTIDPVDFSTFLQLEYNSKLVLTDSGGIQEEACILKVPCVTLRDNTERPETIEVGSNVLAGTQPQKIIKCVKMMLHKKNTWKNPFRDGTAGKKIAKNIN
jgi:UDP-N-acetylglucosamine 2-epimerase (non-hydrolysing)